MNTCPLFEDPVCKKHAMFSTSSSLEDDLMDDSLTSSENISDEIECEPVSCSVSSSSSSLSTSEEPEPETKSHVSFNTSVAVRVVYCDSDESEDDDVDDRAVEESEDSVVSLKKEDNSKPIMESVHFDAEEEAIRSQLVGCICATRRKKHNFAQMYGCGKSIRDDDEDSCDDDDDDDDNFEFTEPPRVIVACAPSASWFTL